MSQKRSSLFHEKIEKPVQIVTWWSNQTSQLSPPAIGDVGQGLVLALLHPAVPRLESLVLQDQFRADYVVLDVVVGEALAAFVAEAAGVSAGTPFPAADLEDAEAEAGGPFRAVHHVRVHPALAVHQADPIADEGPGDAGTLQLVRRLALGQDPSEHLSRRQQGYCDSRRQPKLRRLHFHRVSAVDRRDVPSQTATKATHALPRDYYV